MYSLSDPPQLPDEATIDLSLVEAQLADVSFMTASSRFSAPTHNSYISSKQQVRVSSLKQGTSIARRIAVASLAELANSNDLLNNNFPTSSNNNENNDDAVSVLSFDSLSTKQSLQSTISISHQHVPLRELSFTSNIPNGSFQSHPLSKYTLIHRNQRQHINATLKRIKSSFAQSNIIRYMRLFYKQLLKDVHTKILFTTWKKLYNKKRKMISFTDEFFYVYMRFMLHSAFRSFAAFREKSQMHREHSQTIIKLANDNSTKKFFTAWRNAQQTKHVNRLLRSAVSRMKNKNLLRSLKRWRVYAVITTRWLLILSFHKLKKLTKLHLTRRGKARARKTKYLKRTAFKSFRQNVLHNRTRRHMIITILVQNDTRTLYYVFKTFVLQCKAMDVLAQRRKNSNVIVLKTMQLFHEVRNVQRKHLKPRVLTKWKTKVRKPSERAKKSLRASEATSRENENEERNDK